MVRKIKKIFFFAFFCLLLAMPTQANANEVFSDGSISSTYRDLFEDVLQDINIFEHYVFYRSGQYQYTMVVGKLEYENNIFTCDEYIRYDLVVANSSYQGGAQELTVTTGTDFELDVDTYLVYSDLGYYPKLIERGAIYEFTLLLTICIIALCVLIRPMFKRGYRFRS